MITAASSDNLLGNGSDKVEPAKIFKYLADWLRGHMLGTDKKLGKFLNEKGVN